MKKERSKVFLIAMAYMSVVVGGGFASGNEVIQFFTGYGSASFAGSVIAGLLFAFLGMQIAHMSSDMQAHSHLQLLRRLFGDHLGVLIDFVLCFFLFGVGVVMLAGAGSAIAQQFGLSPLVGSVLMTLLVIATLCLNLKGIIGMISAVMPFLLLVVLAIMVYSLFHGTADHAAINRLAEQFDTVKFLSFDINHWLISAFLYAAFNISVGFPMLAIIGGMTRSQKTAGLGGALGGLGLGFLVVLLNAGLYFNLDKLVGIELPTLLLAHEIHPYLAIFMAIALIAMIYSTAVGMFFSFSTRFATPNTMRFRLVSMVCVTIGLFLSQFGFTELVGTVYPLVGVLGIVLIVAIIGRWFWSWRAAQGQRD